MDTNKLKQINNLQQFLAEYANTWRFTMLQTHIASFQNKNIGIWLTVNTTSGWIELEQNKEKSVFSLAESEILQIKHIPDNHGAKLQTLEQLFKKITMQIDS